MKQRKQFIKYCIYKGCLKKFTTDRERKKFHSPSCRFKHWEEESLKGKQRKK